MDKDIYEGLKLKNQLCFPLYVAAKEIVKKYSPHLSELDLTYTQYITLLALWENDGESVKSLGEKLYLDSGTLTPLLKSLERKGYVSRSRNKSDERSLTVSLTDKGKALKEKAVFVPQKMAKCVSLSPEEVQTLYTLLYKIVG